jgi:hypothetical protein
MLWQDYSDDDAIKEHQAAAERDERAALRQAQVAQEFAQEQQVRSSIAPTPHDYTPYNYHPDCGTPHLPCWKPCGTSLHNFSTY